MIRASRQWKAKDMPSPVARKVGVDLDAEHRAQLYRAMRERSSQGIVKARPGLLAWIVGGGR